MRFDDIAKRESNTDELKKEQKKLQLEFDALYDVYYSKTNIDSLKEKKKQELLTGFYDYFKKLGFSVKSSKEQNKYSGFLETRTATIGNYKVEMSINDSYIIFLSIQHKKDFGKEEYRLSIDICSEDEFDSYLHSGREYKILEYNEALKKDIERLKSLLEINKTLKVVCKFDDGQEQDISKEYDTFEEIIEDIPEK